MRRAVGLVFFVVILALLAGCKEGRSFTIDKVDIRAQLLEDGDLYVEELYTYQFKGEFNGTTRKLKSGGHDGVEFFEAYLPPANAKLGGFSYKEADRLTTELRDNTYRIHTKSNDEIKQVYYRYRLDHAVWKYSDTAEFYWAFFDSDNETDLHNMSVEIMLPQPVDSGEVSYFLHDKTGGLITGTSGRSIHYETELMPAGQKSEFRLLFPTEWLPDSPFTAEENRKESILAREQKLQSRYEQRGEKLAYAEDIIKIASGMILLGILYLALLTPYKLTGLAGRHISRDELEALDPLFVAYIHRNGKLIPKDITAGLFSLYQKGWIEIKKIPASLHYRQDPKAPNETFRFTFIGDQRLLNEYERDFVGWLFKNIPGRNRSFSLESICGPSKEERNNGKAMEAYRKRKKKFDERFEAWKQKVLHHERFAPFFKNNKAVAWVVPILTVFLYAMTLFLYYAEVSSWTAMGWAGVILGAAAAVTVALWRSTRTFMIYGVICFFTVAMVTFSHAIFLFVGTILLSMILRLLLPLRVPTSEGAPYKAAVAKWRRALKRKRYPAGTEAARLERLMQYALILNISKPFAKHHASFESYKELEKAFPLISIPHSTTKSFNHTYDSWSTWGGSYSSGGGSSSGGGGGGGDSGGGGGAGAF